MFSHPNLTSVEATVPAAVQECQNATHLPLQRRRVSGFTLLELLVSVGVLVLLVLLATQLLNSAATITILGHKQMDADSQARQVLDRMALDFAQMVKRSDVDYYVKSSATAPLRRVIQSGNDQIAFYSAVPGYHTSSSSSQSSVSLVSYRVNSENRLERMGKGLVWNAVSMTDTPVLFLPVPLASPLPSPLPVPMPIPAPTPAWPSALSATDWTDSEVMGPQVFRFEYYYLLRNGSLSDIPWDTATHNAVNGMQDVSAIVVDIAVIDSKSKVLVRNSQIASLISAFDDYTSGWGSGELSSRWQAKINNPGLITWGADGPPPRSALAGIRLYERFFYLSPPTL
jgi:type II secretion system protein J